ncbi:MAG: hypothetical protein Q9162_003438 [Coniocarpon cinnabarinum]
MSSSQPEISGTLDDHTEPVAKDEARLVRKFDRHILPLVFVLYVLAFLDRSNIGNARIAGMSRDLDLYGNRYQWFLTIFYIAYILAEVTVVFYKIFPPHYWLAIVTLFWWVLSLQQACRETQDSL